MAGSGSVQHPNGVPNGASHTRIGPSLPTLDRLGIKDLAVKSINPQRVASLWFQTFSHHVQSGDVDGIVSLFIEDSFWRDLLVLTWDFRSFHRTSNIRQFLLDRLAITKPSSFRLEEDRTELEQPYPDLMWIQGLFRFETSFGFASGVFRLVPTPSAANSDQLVWKAHVVLTNLEDLKGHPERIGPYREPNPNHGKWTEQRRREVDFVDRDPSVIIVGGGQNGLGVAARLKYLGISALVVEKLPKVGDNWRTRYEALCLHDPIWYDHMPYLQFPPTWPVFTPARKLADWLEAYAHSLELNIWTSSNVTKVEQDGTTKKWAVTIQRGETGEERSFKVDHLIFAFGFGGGLPRMPKYPGMDEFQGKVIHSSQHKTAEDHIGKKVVVVGACTSAHDICSEHVERGVDITMFQRSPTYVMSTKEGIPRLLGSLYSETGPPLDIADRINASFPNPFLKEFQKRVTKEIAEADKDIIEGLTKRGFKLTWGEEGSGALGLVWTKAGGYYYDVGASCMIIDGRIKLKNDSLIERFTKTSIKFEDGSELECDVVIFATGFDDARDAVIRVLGSDYKEKLKPLWGLGKDGELNGVWRDFGVPNLWYLMGNLAVCRFYSKHMALRKLKY
ncbi:FAD/NAD P-binding domain-containing protein [Gloeophyllum trabeum ATCC 11539]|uniref:FAD/NAD P-binding domain-containing protein n=1 Tax=Gloeophyllum trabeum (strain ATCC 11539 / FP-39264 / Madison 617) TaxID=670483 RepID=S7S1L5_GLOTA|nr:FAD/NAD P-binding domain-containing protein [Gloeophyllum trabeum ATCC 11539]EPQ61345.1 FAD/NAD P-binding domain-containing protein [Gloeophyllum trabeum ATCC 11539]